MQKQICKSQNCNDSHSKTQTAGANTTETEELHAPRNTVNHKALPGI
jgi:hypothetical protein